MRLSKELEQLKRDVAKWQNTPDLVGRSAFISPLVSPEVEKVNPVSAKTPGEGLKDFKLEKEPHSLSALQTASTGEPTETRSKADAEKMERNGSINQIPLLDESPKGSGTALDMSSDDSGVRERKTD